MEQGVVFKSNRSQAVRLPKRFESVARRTEIPTEE